MTRVFGHGPDGSDYLSINRLGSFRRCRAQGVDGVELDVRRTADDHIAVIHDPSLADGRSISATTRADLPEWIPGLDQVLDECAGLTVNIEIKNFPRDPEFDPDQRVTRLIIDLLDARGQRDRALVSCFDFAAIDLVRREAPGRVETAMLYLSRRPPAELLERIRDHGHSIVHPYDTMVDGAFMDEARSRDLEVNVWLGDTPARRLDELVAIGVDGLITSDVAAAIRAVGSVRGAEADPR